MKPRWLLLISLTLNLLLVVAIRVGRQPSMPAAPAPRVMVVTNLVSPVTRTTERLVAPSSPPASWREVTSTNLASFITNLRRTGCPEPTTQVILARALADRYERGFKELTASTNFWMTGAQEEAGRRHRLQTRMALNREREAVFKELLGVDWWTVAGQTQPFDAVLPGSSFSAFLAEDKALRVQLAFQRCDRLQDELDNRADRLITAEEAATRKALTSQLQAELRTFLTPAEYEELELRCATVTVFDVWSLEDQFGCQFTGPELREFLRITRARRPLGSWWTERFERPPVRSGEAQAAEDAQVRALLGETRFRLYVEARRTGPQHRSEK